MKKWEPIQRGELIVAGSQLLNKNTGEWENYYDCHHPFGDGITNNIFEPDELRRPLKAKAVRKPKHNNAQVLLPPSCKACILNKTCKADYAMEQCWHNAVTAYFA